ncbi:SIR2 family protein [uncultured Tateyamaria sp.]|uniref:SIR2 family protein n=1 Tax=uncultured Tateyamaria sp. TaxID=455651 RepID=UPI0026112B41|nr:SIR2 family protein [uncultured Tateyamaria sp.]
MFPYNENAISTPRTSSDIERFGHQALLRALNIGRVVAFAGSGTSLKFGQPTWGEFAERGVKLFFALQTALMAHENWVDGGTQSDIVTDFKKTLGPLVEEIKDLRVQSDFQPSHLIELIEDYFDDIHPLLERHGLMPEDLNKHTFSKRRALALTKLEAAHPTEATAGGWEEYHFGPVVKDTGDLDRMAFKTSEFRRIFAEQFTIMKSPQDNRLKSSHSFQDLLDGLDLGDHSAVKEIDRIRSDIERIDAARTLRRSLGVRRFLTLNYDLELEMMLFEEGRATPIEPYRDFRQFLTQERSEALDDLPYKPGRAVKLESPSGRVVRSSSSRRETLADLFSFGAFPTNYDASVHHLHGRIDDPKNMIVTPKDYQRIYYGASDQKKSFDEARHAVFTGSDILVLGMGTSEHDVLKPLRDFLELEADRRDAYGNVYYITATEFSGKQSSLWDAMQAARLSAKSKTQSLYKDYGMHTLFIDQSFDNRRSRSWTGASASLFAARAEIAFYLNATKGTARIEPWASQEVQKDFDRLFHDINRFPASGAKPEKIRLTEKDEITLARALIKSWNTLDPQDTAQGQERRNQIRTAFAALDSHLKDTGLVEFAERLETSRREWWSDWSEFPGLRVAVLGRHFYKLDPAQDLAEQAKNPRFKVVNEWDDAPLVWRQTNLDARFRIKSLQLGNMDETPQFTGLLKATEQARSEALEAAKTENEVRAEAGEPLYPTQFPASVARISIPPGGGKGRLLTYFTKQQKTSGAKDGETIWPFQTLFGDPKTLGAANRNYKACFMSHLTYALEFSGTMIAFARMLQNMLPLLRQEVTPEHQADPLWDEMLDHQFQERNDADPCISTLRDMFALFRRTCPETGWKTRMVAIFSYLDRLVDENGDAYSPHHRAFFRLVSGWNDANQHMQMPFDCVLINCYADQPIRYLSIEKPVNPKKDKRRNEVWAESNWRLRHDRRIALQHWTELDRVRPRIIFQEALERIARLPPIAVAQNPQDSADALSAALEIKEDVNDFLQLPSNLNKFMYRRVANGYFLAGLANTIWHLRAGDVQGFRDEWQRCISALDIAYAREKSRGLIEELMSIYRRLDREIVDLGLGTNDDPESDRRDAPPNRIGSTARNRNRERLRTMTIDHLALLQVPATPETLMTCPDVKSALHSVSRAENDTPLEILTQELNLLVGRGLASRYKRFADEVAGKTVPRYVYVLNTKVASVLRARANLEVYSQYRLMVFQPNAYPSQPERALKPDVIHLDRVDAVIRALVKSTHQDLVQKYWNIRRNEYTWPDDATIAAEMEQCNDKLRAAYALIRGTFSISVIARLAESSSTDKRIAPFDQYRTWTRKLLNTATLLRKIRERDMERRLNAAGPRFDVALPYNNSFLRDEVSWLYNERALVSFVQGRLFDALPLFEQAQVMLGNSSKRSAPQSQAATHRRIQMNFALAQVERGNIVSAQETLTRIVTETERRWDTDTPSVIHWMAKGFMALCHHLTNEFTRAKEDYEKVLDEIGAFNHPRAESIFRRHYGDLLRAMATSRNDPEYKEAISHLRSSEELALGIRATDLHHYAIMAQARLHRDMQDRGQALENLRRVEEYARSMGIQKMLSEVLKVRGEVLLAEGETTQAGFVTAQSIAISKRNGMRLRKISASIIQARILQARNQTKDAERLLNETITESQVLGYATKTSQAVSLIKAQ